MNLPHFAYCDRDVGRRQKHCCFQSPNRWRIWSARKISRTSKHAKAQLAHCCSQTTHVDTPAVGAAWPCAAIARNKQRIGSVSSQRQATRNGTLTIATIPREYRAHIWIEQSVESRTRKLDRAKKSAMSSKREGTRLLT